MSAREIAVLAPGDTAVVVTSGTADVFYAPEEGAEFPVATVHAGAIVPAAATTVTLRVVPRIDCEMADFGAVVGTATDPAAVERAATPADTRTAPPADTATATATPTRTATAAATATSTQTAAATSTNVDVDTGVAAFVKAVAADLPDSQASDLAGTATAEVPAALDRILPQRFQQARTERRRRATASVADDHRQLTSAYQRAEADARNPGRVSATVATDELVAVLGVLGEDIGFSVPEMDDIEPSEAARPVADRLPALSHACGIRYRPVSLTGDWRKPASPAYLAIMDGPGGQRPVALIPHGRRYMVHTGNGAPGTALSDADLTALSETAWEIYPPLDRTRAVTWIDVARVAMRRTGREWAWITAMALGVALLGLLTPILTKFVLNTAVPQGRTGLLVQTGVALGAAAAVAGAFSLVQYFAMSRVTQRSTQRVQPAFWDRVLSMPPSFFRDFSSGDLSVRVMAVDALEQLVNVQVIGASLAAMFSLVNLALMYYYSPLLGIVGTVVLLVTIGVFVLGVRATQRLYVRSIDAQLEGTSWVVQLLTGIQKVRLAGAETRMQARYLDMVRVQVVSLSQMTQVMGRISAWTIFAVAAAPAMFFLAVGASWSVNGEPISSSTFLAFNAAFIAAFGAISALSSVVTPLASARPIFHLMHPLMESLPEAATHRSDPGRLGGQVEFRNVEFRYEQDSPLVLDRLSFHVSAGEMVAIVGPSGSGKSTTLRLVLGFDSPEDGQVLLDGRDLADLDLDLVRRQMGVVIQDGQITRTSILKNILAGANTGEDAAWKAAEAAALADDIENMPMKMQTIVDPQLLSGGQAQRLLLARALVRQPSLVVLDEATSALDNVSQAKVSQALEDLGATRIVVAHRLSTIKTADRILVVDHGRIVEEGTYDELMQKDGLFTQLAERQTA